MTRLVLALDQGTTGSTALVVDEGGRVLGRGYREITQHFPQPGWVEHDPEEIWNATLAAGREALAAARAAGRDLAGLGITNQRETTVLWDRRTGAALHRAIVWQDRRTAERCRRLDRKLIARKTGLVPDPYFSATKVEWTLKKLKPRLSSTAFGTVDSWLVHRLTRGTRARHRSHQRLAHDALRHRRAAAGTTSCSKLFRVPREILPDVRPSSGLFGARRRRVVRRRGADRGDRGRPAGRAVRPGGLRRRIGEEHLRHRRLPPAQHGEEASCGARAGSSPPWPATRAADRPTRSRARSSSPARRSSGCATGSA